MEKRQQYHVNGVGHFNTTTPDKKSTLKVIEIRDYLLYTHQRHTLDPLFYHGNTSSPHFVTLPLYLKGACVLQVL